MCNIATVNTPGIMAQPRKGTIPKEDWEILEDGLTRILETLRLQFWTVITWHVIIDVGCITPVHLYRSGIVLVSHTSTLSMGLPRAEHNRVISYGISCT